MGIIDNLKEGVKSSKEKAVLGALGPAMAMIESWTKDIKPTNQVSEFIEQNLGILFEVEGKSDPVMALLIKIAVGKANEDPKQELNKLLRFYESFRVFYGNNLKSSMCNSTADE